MDCGDSPGDGLSGFGGEFDDKRVELAPARTPAAASLQTTAANDEAGPTDADLPLQQAPGNIKDDATDTAGIGFGVSTSVVRI